MAQDSADALVRMLHLHERREPAVVEVATWVGLGVIEGRLRPGQDLNSVDLSHRFNCSRTPVREALMLLEQEGLVEMRARHRPRVAPFTAEVVREIYTVRQYLFALVARLVVEHAQDAEIADMEQRTAVMSEQAASGDIEGYFWSHAALHERMTEIAGNGTLKGILDSLALRTLIVRHAGISQPGRLHESAEHQRRIVQAIKQRDADLAALLLSRSTMAALAAIVESGWLDSWTHGLPVRKLQRERTPAAEPEPEPEAAAGAAAG